MNSNYTQYPFSELPKVLNAHILNYVIETPIRFTEHEVKHCGRVLSTLAVTSKKFSIFIIGKLEELKKIHTLINKYSAYNEEYNSFSKDNYAKRELIHQDGKHECTFYPGGNPQLIDALCTDKFKSTFDFKSTFSEYTQEIEKDIKEIVKLMPQSLQCSMGSFGARTFVGPLTIACLNKSIPTEIIEFLLEKGVPKNKSHYFMPMLIPVTVIGEMKVLKFSGKIENSRFLAILSLFDKHK